ncbi:16S rRNA (guanine(527)-N(7))-methyltransferase RsmG [Moraxella sp. FZLJ2107]|uniref:16S rRNA (guanine(527)-N(7))-methyltransferase RsmG n=1 Tax=unclassified Moraxella TaxID=2685852 RepID=UPI0020C93157|nr:MULTISPECIES: 16S rRNA (guanine(527)-N(7))-methyltransferase RsmG [unclassified Moraxella]UTO05887.1 16S rRNA (guanine(527)-N(7))-methyltransferase RsmG [Moraxella sp. FZLJ2107]UTO22623.1 16S rRNA (guanine(527)-N(7))-methyltransferase RsmG [Moraxella sp. FZLJ2109]
MTVKFSKISHKADTFAAAIKDAAASLGIALNDDKTLQILRYLDGLLLWGKAYNLTAITDPDDALIKHIFDCMAIIPDLPFAERAGVKLLDIGTGAGLPSVIIAIIRDDWQVDALDSNSKKIRFIRQIASEIGLKNITPIASRIEHHHADKSQAYDVITSRAFASLSDFVNLAEPCLTDNGMLYAMKGKVPSDDEKQSLDVWQISVKTIQVPKLNDDRCVVYLNR